MSTGRTVTKWIRFMVEDSGSTPREIPIDSLSPIGFVFDEVDVTAWQDQVKGYLSGHPECEIEISGPFDTSAAVGLAASAATPALSGSHTVLSAISAPTFTTPVGLIVAFGQGGYWEDTEPTFGVATSSATEGYHCTRYTVDGSKYTARFKPCPGATPEWGSDILA